MVLGTLARSLGAGLQLVPLLAACFLPPRQDPIDHWQTLEALQSSRTATPLPSPSFFNCSSRGPQPAYYNLTILFSFIPQSPKPDPVELLQLTSLLPSVQTTGELQPAKFVLDSFGFVDDLFPESSLGLWSRSNSLLVVLLLPDRSYSADNLSACHYSPNTFGHAPESQTSRANKN